MQKKLSRDQIQTILTNSPKELQTETILQGLVDRGYILEGYNEPKPNLAQKIADVAIGGASNLANTAINYTGAAIDQATGMSGSKTFKESYDRLAQFSENDAKQNAGAQTILGRNNISRDLSTGKGWEQLGGDALSTAATVMPAGSTLQGATLGAKVAQGAKIGATVGALGGAGTSMQEGNSLGEVAKDTFVGAGTGAAVGGAIPAVGEVIKKTAGGVKGVAQPVTSAVKNKITGLTDNVKDPVKALESSYDEIFKTNSKTSIIKQVENSKNRGYNPSKFLSQRGIILDVEDGSIKTANARDLITGEAKKVDELLSEGLGQVKATVSLDDLKVKALKKIDTTYYKAKGADYNKMAQQIIDEIDAYKANFGDTVNLSTLNEMKSGQWFVSGFDATKSNAIRDTHKILGNVFKTDIEKVAKDNGVDGIKELNNFLGEHYDTLEVLQRIDGGKIKGGRLGNALFSAIGAATGMNVGDNPIVNAVLGGVGGNKVSEILQGLKVSNPVRNAMLKKMEATTPEVVAKFANQLENLPTKATMPTITKNVPITSNISPILQPITQKVKEEIAKDPSKAVEVIKNLASGLPTAVKNQIIKELVDLINE